MQQAIRLTVWNRLFRCTRTSSRREAGSLLLALLLLFGAQTVPAQERRDALAAYRQGRYELAVEITREELAEDPGNLDAHTVAGWSQLALGRYDEALETADRALAVSSTDYRIVQIRGEALYFLGRNLEALSALERYIQLAPAGASRLGYVYFLVGELLIRFSEYHSADIALSTAVHHSPSFALWWARLGWAREQAGRTESALAAYDQALSIDSSLSEAVRGRERLSSSGS